MENRPSDEMSIRRYLLGLLETESEVLEALDKQMLEDNELSDLAELIEDEIIEEYLEGTLDPIEKDAVERHFLRPAERREKLRSARLLTRHLAAEPQDRKNDSNDVLSSPVGPWNRRIAYAAPAATLLLVVCLGYVVHLKRASNSEIAKLTNDLSKEKEHSAGLVEKVQELRVLGQSSVVLLTLLQPGVRRAPAPVQELEIGTATQRVHVEIPLQGVSSGAFDVRLERAGAGAPRTVVSIAQLESFRSRNGALLIFDMPTQGIEPGDYRFTVRESGGTAGEITYRLHVSRPHDMR
jgi:hypothetical protein